MSSDGMLRRYEAGSSGFTSEEEDEEHMEYEHGSYHAPDPLPESMVPSSLRCRSPWPNLKPLRFTPQVPVTPLQSPETEEYTKLNVTTTLQSPKTEEYTKLNVTTVSTVITWQYEGLEVAIEGSWDDWKKREYLQSSDGGLMITKVLPVGVYLYRFIVDGQRRCAPDLPQESDDEGNLCNILDLERHVLEREFNVLETESSPLSSYNNEYFSSEDFKHKVPELPPFLENIHLNQHQSSDDPQEKPLPCVLNHLFLCNQPTGSVTLSSTQRFRQNHVTVYKSLENL